MHPANLQPAPAKTAVPAQPTVLIVEHDASTRELYRRTLSRDFQVLACGDETEAMQLLNDSHLQAVILEPAMYGGRGWDLLTKIKETPALKSIPVILCSTLDERKRGLELGAAMCMVKPVLPSDLLDTVHRIATSSKKMENA